MSFFEQLGKRISDAGQGVAQQTKNLAEAARLNGMISDAEKQIEQLFLTLGQSYYQKHKDDPAAEDREILDRVGTLYGDIARYQESVSKIKGMGVCPSCGAAVPPQAAFCNTCGAKIAQDPPEAPPAPEGQRLCPHCQTPIVEGNLFCVGCGAKIEEQ